MKNISIQRYASDAGHGFSGCIEPEDKSWVLFIHANGATYFYGTRDPQTGAVVVEEVTS